MEKAKAIAELSNIRINQEINILNHELRTPLSSLMAASELISYKENSHKKFLIKTIKQSSSILQDHLNNLIENRKIEAGNFSIKLKQTNIKQLIEDCGLIFYTNPDNRKRKFSVFISNDGMPESIMTDPVKIRQILINLISNAIKFSQQGPILINLSRHENNLYISITDQGIGIKKSSQKHIFEAYSRENDKIAGTGLGLAISSKTANLLKGQITVKSEYGKGSTFTLKIPIILPKFNKDVIGKKSVNAPYYLWKQLNEWGFKTHINNSSSQNLSDPIYLFTPFSLYLDALNLSHHKKTFIQKNNLRHHYRLKILLVDDFEINLEIFSLMLKSLGHDVQRANTGYKALQMGSENIYDVVFMDIRMKDLDGVQTTQKWKENQNILDNNTPIVALTADTLDIKKYQEKNIFFQIASKPIDRTMFEKIIKDVIDFQKNVVLNCL
ncbi:hypothetical protein CF386_08050 [Paraphotobacterium marinum]|uniref:histidine kinase n=1 Tax=Paraphotobacterium marinum TaxID=1755811 RepID=A0A220VFC9_9GAMM|nr:ATP-binding protein [Paraphotobacterium marinum]ASK79011.1 hypothetical protein CF386_08050 [Paraphotobacterium marinum]